MKITELLRRNSDRITVSFEVIPSQKGLSKNELIENLKPLMEVKPLFVDVTTHRNRVEIHNTDTGHFFAEHHRYVSTLPICQVIAEHFGVEVMPHIMCGNFTKQETEEFLIDATFCEFDNLFAVRGDKLQYEPKFTPNRLGNAHASDLIKQISDYNEGLFIDKSITMTQGHDFCIGACCYPEQHVESPNLQEDIKATIARVNAGAEFLISQMFFDNSKFYEMQSNLIDVPIIPGLKILSSVNQYWNLPRVFGVKIPEDLRERFNHCDKEEAGVSYCVDQCKDLIDKGFKHLHFFTMNGQAVLKVLKEIL